MVAMRAIPYLTKHILVTHVGPSPAVRLGRREDHSNEGYRKGGYAPRMSAFKKCGIVLCDDQKAFRDVMSIALAVEPEFEVLGEAANGEEAVRVVAALQPDIVLLDIAMPVLDGLEALPLILESAPETQVVMLTGFASHDLRARALSTGASLFIEKGTNMPELVGEIKALCRADVSVN
jgi:DNA-binding NarL/FixJ family response regulator